MAGLRGEAPVVAFTFFRLVMPVVSTIVALIYTFFVLDAVQYPPVVKICDVARRGRHRVLLAQRIRAPT